MFKRGVLAGITFTCLAAWINVHAETSATTASTEAPVQAEKKEIADPQVVVASTVDELTVRLVKEKDQVKENPELLVAMMDEMVMPLVDDTRMAKLALGKNWKKLDKDQRTRFKAGFKGLLVDTYSAAFLAFDGEEIKYDKTRFDKSGKRAIVRSKIMLKGRAPVGLDYKMFITKEKEWLMYDVTVAGVGLIQAYRNVFAQEIKRVGVDQMVVNLETKKLGK